MAKLMTRFQCFRGGGVEIGNGVVFLFPPPLSLLPVLSLPPPSSL